MRETERVRETDRDRETLSDMGVSLCDMGVSGERGREGCEGRDRETERQRERRIPVLGPAASSVKQVSS